MIAKCKHPGHEACVFTRTVNPNMTANRAGQGRCLGLLTAWCLACSDHADKPSHKKLKPDRPARIAGRAHLRAQPNSAFYFAQERPRRENEESEPEQVP